MRASGILIPVCVYFLSATAGAVTVKVEGVKIADDDLFVAWSDACTGKVKADPKGVDISEKNFQYSPRALVATLGTKLHVHNADKGKHNSFALKNVNFDSGLQKPNTTYEVALSKPGVTKLFCRVHPKMAADVLVLDKPCFRELRGENALSSFELPPGAGKNGKLWLWSPRLKGFQSSATGAFTLKKDDFLTAAPGVSSEPETTYY